MEGFGEEYGIADPSRRLAELFFCRLRTLFLPSISVLPFELLGGPSGGLGIDLEGNWGAFWGRFGDFVHNHVDL